MLKILVAVGALAGSAAAAETFSDVRDRGEFVALVDGRTLTTLGVRLNVAQAGSITGSAFGKDVVGGWTWQNGYFCRSLRHGSRDLAYNCQLVQRQSGILRFISDRGEGPRADLKIR